MLFQTANYPFSCFSCILLSGHDVVYSFSLSGYRYCLWLIVIISFFNGYLCYSIHRPRWASGFGSGKISAWRLRLGSRLHAISGSPVTADQTSASGSDYGCCSPQSIADIDEVDYIVIGSGIGGLSAAAMLSYYGYEVLVLESHYLPGGVAHTFEKDGFKFDAGPSLWNGMNTKPYNPLREILEVVDEGCSIKYASYDGWMMHIPEGSFKFTVGEGKFESIIKKFGGIDALREWNELLSAVVPLQALAAAVPPLTIRSDVGVLLTLLPHLQKLLQGVSVANQVESNFQAVLDRVGVKDQFLNRWFDFLSFALSGLPASGTIAAAVVYTMRDLHQQRASLDYPIGGSAAVVEALIRGITKHGRKGKVVLNSHVEAIITDAKVSPSDGDNDKGKLVCSGVKLRRGGKTIRARKRVISNASVWDTTKLLPEHPVKQALLSEMDQIPMTNSFVHLHLGINASGLPENLESHYSVINTWSAIDAPQNHVIISIPSVLDPSLCPPNCHVIHAYAAANEPYDLWSNLSQEEYYKMKDERCKFLWAAIERSIPDVRERVIIELPASPWTHERFNRRYKGTFGPGYRAGKRGEKFPYPNDVCKGVEGLLCVGDSAFPGIGIPAVAVSGAIAASSTVSVWEHLKMLDKLYKSQ